MNFLTKSAVVSMRGSEDSACGTDAGRFPRFRSGRPGKLRRLGVLVFSSDSSEMLQSSMSRNIRGAEGRAGRGETDWL